MTNDKRITEIEIGKACIGGLLDTITGSVTLTASEIKEIESYIDQLKAENAKLREENIELQKENNRYHDLYVRALNNSEMRYYRWTDERQKNVKLREQMELLITILRNDCDIDASWDGLRRFWNIELTEGGCLMRDRVYNAEVENVKLRELVNEMRVCVENECKRCHEWSDLERRMRKLKIEVD